MLALVIGLSCIRSRITALQAGNSALLAKENRKAFRAIKAVWQRQQLYYFM